MWVALGYSHERYIQLWGSSVCTNSLPFEYSDLLLKRYQPKLQTELCDPDIGSLCEPQKMHPRFAPTTTGPETVSEAAKHVENETAETQLPAAGGGRSTMVSLMTWSVDMWKLQELCNIWKMYTVHRVIAKEVYG